MDYERHLCDWGFLFGFVYGIARGENPYETDGAVASRAVDAARIAYKQWSGDIHPRPEWFGTEDLDEHTGIRYSFGALAHSAAYIEDRAEYLRDDDPIRYALIDIAGKLRSIAKTVPGGANG